MVKFDGDSFHLHGHGIWRDLLPSPSQFGPQFFFTLNSRRLKLVLIKRSTYTYVSFRMCVCVCVVWCGVLCCVRGTLMYDFQSPYI